MTTTIGRVKFPVLAIVRAIPKAIRAAKAEHAQNKDEGSAAGSTVTAGEVGEEILAFVGALAEEVMPVMLKANGLA